MCASLLRQFGIKKVFFGASNEKFGGTGGVLDIHYRNGRVGGEGEGEEGDYEVSGGWLREEAIVMLRRFYVQENNRGESAFLDSGSWNMGTNENSAGTEEEGREGVEVGSGTIGRGD